MKWFDDRCLALSVYQDTKYSIPWRYPTISFYSDLEDPCNVQTVCRLSMDIVWDLRTLLRYLQCSHLISRIFSIRTSAFATADNRSSLGSEPMASIFVFLGFAM